MSTSMATTSDSFLIADTSGLISLAVKSDSNHEPALAATERLQGKRNTILVPYEVRGAKVRAIRRQWHAVE